MPRKGLFLFFVIVGAIFLLTDKRPANRERQIDYKQETLEFSNAHGARWEKSGDRGPTPNFRLDGLQSLDPIPTTLPLYYRDKPCTQDCSGHEAGYEWAEENSIDNPDDCDGNSESFVEGCQTYAEEQQTAKDNAQDDGDEDNPDGYD